MSEARGTANSPVQVLTTTDFNAANITPLVTGEEGMINIRCIKFDPLTSAINAGTVSTWTNQDTLNHPVTADNGS
jgi:plastocyanin